VQVQITSTQASHICYTTVNANTPACAAAGTCTNSLSLPGTSGYVSISASNTVIKAVGCDEQDASTDLATSKTFQPIGSLVFTPSAAGAYASVQMSASNADHLCYNTAGGTPSCSGTTCTSGILYTGSSYDFTLPASTGIIIRAVACDKLGQPVGAASVSAAYDAGTVERRPSVFVHGVPYAGICVLLIAALIYVCASVLPVAE
jgi:hypothetical protein